MSLEVRKENSMNTNTANAFKIIPKGEIALLEFDLKNEKVNKLSSPVMSELDHTLGELAKSSYKAVVLISRKDRIFIAGADIEEIKNLKNAQISQEMASMGQKILNKIEDLKMPVIAAINGACLGGGCELAMACDYRIMSDDPSSQIGLPETKLGVIPGFGGCIRMPRIIGLQASLDMILAGKSAFGKKAAKVGLVDQIVPAAILEEQAIKFASDLVKSGAKKRRKKFKSEGALNIALETIGRSVVLNQAKKMTMKLTRGHYPAPLKAISVIRDTYGMTNREKALSIEAKGFGEVAATDVSKHLINLFYMTEGIKKQTGVQDTNIKAENIEKICVLGAGTMGGGIAQLGADKGFLVRMKDINNNAIALGLQAAQKIWQKDVEKKKLNTYEYQKKFSNISGGTNYDGFKNTDVVIEAIVEDMNIKKKVLEETFKHCPSNVIIASNTSSLSINEMSKAHPHPENFIGMHFFNPVDKMPLIEVIRGEKTSDQTTATIFNLCKKLGKIPVVMKDGPGFVVNRLLLPYLNESMYLMQEGYSIEDIDRAYLEYGMPMGPCHLLDEIGIDVAVKVSKIFHQAFGDRAKPSEVMEKTGKSGRLGKKNKKGFYKYDSRGKKTVPDTSIYTDLGLGLPNKKLDAEEGVQRGIYMMINEAALMFVEDRIVSKPEEVDLAMIMGTGFPPFRGGLLKYADSIGTENIVDTLEVFANKIGPRFKPSQPLKNMAKTKRKFYS